MSTLANQLVRMSVDEYLAWLETQPERPRYELVDGIPVAMAPERAIHNTVKAEIYGALKMAIGAADLPCRAFTDGMTVQTDEETAYEPDAVVVCGETIADDTIVLKRPVIIVEVLSPSTRQVDKGKKLADYFNIASLRHYLIVDPVDRLVIHHCRDEAGVITTSIIRDGLVKMSPPDLTVALAGLFA